MLRILHLSASFFGGLTDLVFYNAKSLTPKPCLAALATKLLSRIWGLKISKWSYKQSLVGGFSPTPKKWVDIWLIYGYYMVKDG